MLSVIFAYGRRACTNDHALIIKHCFSVTCDHEDSKAKQKINDENLSYEEREAALEQVRVAEIALSKQEEQLAKDRLAALEALAALSDSNKEYFDH